MAAIKAVFSASLLQSSVSHDLQKSSAAQETFMIIISVENSCAASYFGENYIIISSEEQHGSRVQGFFICHIINYTGYNQKWNVDQIRSAQWTVQRITVI